MAEEKLLTVRDVSVILGISERKVLDLAESGELPAYKVGGVYLRFKREQIQEYKRSLKHIPAKGSVPQKDSFQERLSDFFYFNDFYIFTSIVIILLLLVIFRGY